MCRAFRLKSVSHGVCSFFRRILSSSKIRESSRWHTEFAHFIFLLHMIGSASLLVCKCLQLWQLYKAFSLATFLFSFTEILMLFGTADFKRLYSSRSVVWRSLLTTHLFGFFQERCSSFAGYLCKVKCS